MIEVDVATYPFKYRALFAAVCGSWSVEPIPTGTRVELRFDLTPRPVPGIRLLVQRLLPRFVSEMDHILASYARLVEDSSEAGPTIDPVPIRV